MPRDINGSSNVEAPAPVAEQGLSEPAGNGEGTAPGPARPVSTAPGLRDMCELTGTGRVALPPQRQTSRNDNVYVILRVAQNVKLLDKRITNWLDLLCFGAKATIAEGLAVGQEILFRGTFALDEYTRRDGSKAAGLKVDVDYLRPGPRPAGKSPSRD